MIRRDKILWNRFDDFAVISIPRFERISLTARVIFNTLKDWFVCIEPR